MCMGWAGLRHFLLCRTSDHASADARRAFPTAAKALDLSTDARPSLEPASDAAGPPAQPTAEPTSTVDDQAAAAQAGANPDAPADLAP